MDELTTLLAEREIRRRLLDYCRGIDRCDAELVASAYHDGAYDDHGSYKGDAATFAEYATKALRATCDATVHGLGDSIIDFDEAGETAWVETYVSAQHLRHDDDGPFLEWFAGRYVDRFERRDGDWRIAHRVCCRTWDKVERIELAFEPGRFTEGSRDRDDLAYRHDR